MEQGKILVMTEKFDQAKALAPVLGVRFAKGRNYAEGTGFVLCWGQGHLLDSLMPGDQDPAWAGRWDVARLPMIPDVKLKCGPSPKTSRLLDTVVRQMRRKDVSQIWCGTDADREGTLIFNRVLDHADVDKPVRYLVYHDLTRASLAAAIKDPKDPADMAGVVRAAYLRAWADWVIGLNLTQGFSARFDDSIDTGRVMTPTLQLIKTRQDAISSFVPTDYWVVEGTATTASGETFRVRFDSGKGEHPGRLASKAAADKVLADLLSGQGKVTGAVTVSEDVENPLLFAMNSLQVSASAVGINTGASMRAAQSIYSRKHLITYPRTASPFINYQVLAKVPSAVKALSGMYPDLCAEALGEIAARKGRKEDWFKCVWPAKAIGHHGIVATSLVPGTLSGDEKKIHDMVCRRFLAAFMPRAVRSDTDAVIESGGHRLVAKGRVWENIGWMKAEPWRDTEDSPLPPLAEGDNVSLDLSVVKRTTKPPVPMTEGELLTLMKTAGKLVEDDDAAAAMAEEGIGRPATRTACINKLIDIEYATRKGKVMDVTPAGAAKLELVKAITPDVATPAMTGQWEIMLNRVEAGESDGMEFEESIKSFVSESVLSIREARRPSSLPAQPGVGPCPDCGEPVVDSRMHYVCSGGCGFRFYKNWGGIRLTDKMVGEILAGGTKSDYLFTKKNGTKKTSFEAGLHLEKDEKTGKSRVCYRFVDWESRPPVGPCPKCGGDVTENHAVFACAKECGFVMYKSVLGGRLTRPMAKQLLENGVTRFQANLYSRRTRKRYRSKLALHKTDHTVVLPKYAG